MADYTLTKAGQNFYYCHQTQGQSLCSTYSSYTIRSNSSSTSAWIRTTPISTGNYNVTKIKLRIEDCNNVQYSKAWFGISSSLYTQPSGTTKPNCEWSATASYELHNGYNSYVAEFSVNMQAGVNYYIYLFLSDTSSGAWGALTWPLQSSDSRATKLYVDYTTKTEAGSVRIYTSSGWTRATPYVYTSSGWKKAIPYVYTSSGWVMSS